MSITPLILRGQLKVGGTDVSDEVTEFTIHGVADTIVVPSTLQSDTRNLGGAAEYSITIGYLAVDGSGGVLFPALWAALTNGTKELAFEGYMHASTGVSVINPKWTGTFIISTLELGGDVNTLSAASATFPLTGAPVMATS